MKTFYFDCSSGICGDLTLSAFLDLGADLEKVNSDIGLLKLEEEPRFESKKTNLKGISGTTASVKTNKFCSKQRSFAEIKSLIEKSALKDFVKDKSVKIFEVIAKAESRVHDVPLEKVHFHEIGAVDSIADIVGVASCFNQFEPFKAFFSELPVSSGTIKTQHGILPLPAPATALILEGIPVYGTDTDKELITPTGAGIAKIFANSFGNFPHMTITRSGTGHAKNSFENLPGLLRIFEGEPSDLSDSDSVFVLETNIDNFNPEFYEHIQSLLFGKGALDVCLINVAMKKGRPGTILNVICKTDDLQKMSDIILAQTSSIGLRYYEAKRKKLKRELARIETPWGNINVKKILSVNGTGIYPEYEDLRKISKDKNIPIHELHIEVSAFLNQQK